MPESTIVNRLRSLNITLPVAPKPVASYLPAVLLDGILTISGQIPIQDGNLIATGSVPSQTSIGEAIDAARQCTLNAIAVAAAALDGNLDRIQRIIRVGVFVASDTDFFEQPKVANGVSDLLLEIFGEPGRHARAAVGVIALPLNATIEVEMTMRVKDF